MYVTLRQAAVQGRRVREGGLGAVAAAAALAALPAARGNSGLLLSQMLRGFARCAAECEAMNPQEVANAMCEAVAGAKEALAHPVAGTMLTVAEAAARAANAYAEAQSSLSAVCAAAARAAEAALAQTPAQLDVLKQAGVVDAGGAGIVAMLAAPLEPAFARATQHAIFLPQQSVGENRYCTEFVVQGASCEPAELRNAVAGCGNSLIVAGAKPTLKVHVHTSSPDGVRRIVQRYGRTVQEKIEDMQRQHAALFAREDTTSSVVALVSGYGFDRIARDLGAEQTIVAIAEPSVEQFRQALAACSSVSTYIVLDRERATRSAQAAASSDRSVRVLALPDPPSAMAALLALRSDAAKARPERCRGADGDRILIEAARTRTARVFFDGKEPGAVAGGLPLRANSLEEAAMAAASQLGASEGGLLTLYYGGAQREGDAQALCRKLRDAFAKAEVQSYCGGQTDAEYWISHDD